MVFKLLTPKEAANFMGISIRSFWNLKDRGLPIRAVSISDKRNQYRISFSDLLSWYYFKKKYSNLELKQKIEVDKNASFYVNFF
jgi:hypothetical protein